MSAIPHHTHGRHRRVHRYSNARRDRIRSLVMLAVGSAIIGTLLFLIATK